LLAPCTAGGPFLSLLPCTAGVISFPYCPALQGGHLIFGRGQLPKLAPNWGVIVWLIGWLMLLAPAIVFLYQKMK
jgi:hypothetical protein